MKKPKISIIIPVYNSQKYLRKCLESIILQSLQEIEIIVINDGSEDNSLDLLLEYKNKDKRIILIDKPNGGVSSARNVALKIAKGEYFLNVDSDDWIEEKYCEELYKRAKKNNLDIVVSDFFDDWDNGRIQYNKQLSLLDSELINPIEYLKKIFEGETSVVTWNKLIKREIYIENKIYYPEEIRIGEDLVVLCKLIYFSKKIGKINKAYYHYIHNLNSAMKNIKIKEIENWINAFNKIEYFFNDKEIKSDTIIYRKLKSLAIIFNLEIEEAKENMSTIEKFIRILKSENIKYRYFPIKLKIYYFILKNIPSKKVFFCLNMLNRNLRNIKHKIINKNLVLK